MNTQKILLLAIGFLFNSQVFALTQTGALGVAASATDYYEVKCAKNINGDTSYLQFSIMDSTKNAKSVMNAQITKGAFALTTSDNAASDLIYSPVLKVIKGNGSYFVSVNKTGADARLYSFNALCMSVLNKATAATIVVRQNQ